MAIQKELLRQIIKENDLKSAGDVYSLLKDSFKDLLQELLEADLDVSLGYDKMAGEHLETPFTQNVAAAHQEILIYGDIPPEAIITEL